VDKLSSGLKAKNVAVRPVPGELLWGQVVTELKNEEDAVEMLRKAMADCAVDKFWKVSLVGDPKPVQSDAVQTQLAVKLKFHVDMDAWRQFQQNLRRLLEAKGFAAYKSTLSPTPQESRTAEGFYELTFATAGLGGMGMPGMAPGGMPGMAPGPARPKSRAGAGAVPAPAAGLAGIEFPGTGPVVYLLNRASRIANQTYWDVYQLPEATLGVFGEVAQRTCQLRLQLTDDAGNTLVQSENPLRGPFWDPMSKMGAGMGMMMPGGAGGGTGPDWANALGVCFMPRGNVASAGAFAQGPPTYCVSPFMVHPGEEYLRPWKVAATQVRVPLL
jgi:hypothetical protein